MDMIEPTESEIFSGNEESDAARILENLIISHGVIIVVLRSIFTKCYSRFYLGANYPYLGSSPSAQPADLSCLSNLSSP
jgi:nicotinamide riboside kinase